VRTIKGGFFSYWLFERLFTPLIRCLLAVDVVAVHTQRAALLDYRQSRRGVVVLAPGSH
jgi:hypothetical protein